MTNPTLQSASALQITIIPVFRRVGPNPSAATITASYTQAMGFFLGDVYLSEMERLDKPCAIIIRISVNDKPLGHLITIMHQE